MYRDKILQRDWGALYSALGQGLYTHFTRPFPLSWVWLARLVSATVIPSLSYFTGFYTYSVGSHIMIEALLKPLVYNPGLLL